MTSIHPNITAVSAFAPATCANIAVGFDILGLAVEGVGDSVTLTRRNDEQIIIESIETAHDDEQLPLSSDKNTASVVIQKACAELKLSAGFSIRIKKGIPLSSGMGGSAASAVAALTAFNAFLQQPLSLHELARFALHGEEIASGQAHPDNIVPCIFGGFTLIRSSTPIEVVKLPAPHLFCVLVHPHLQVSTKEARSILKSECPNKTVIQQSANLAGFISSLYEHDLGLMKKSLHDVWIEPQRAAFVPGFYHVQDAALQAGAIGTSFSGSGPTLFAFAQHHHEAEHIAAAMKQELRKHNVESEHWISRISKQGAYILHLDQGQA